jgi:S1-C subfamily serine protease
MALTWEVVDTEGDRVIYSKTIGAAAERKGDDTDVIADAGHSAIVQLLADAEFIRAFRSAPPRAVTPPQQPQRGVPRIVGRWQNPLPTPAEIIRIRPVDANIAPAASVLESAMAGVIALSGPAGHGSGFLITRRGFALTNAHVVSDNEPLIARFRGGRELAVRVVRTDQSADIALVEVDCADTCPTVPLGVNLDPQVGDEVYAVGTPVADFLSHSVTSGIVSGLRLVQGTTVIQTDAALNPGSSGGPLLAATSGAVIGVVSAKLSGNRLEGLGFAVSIQDALRVVGVRH